MVVEAGHFALALALGLSLIQCIVPIWGTRTDDPVLMSVAPATALAVLACVAFAFLSLVVAYLGSDFSVLNVIENSHSSKPLIYKLTGVWGNHEGSMLLWTLILALFGGVVAVARNSVPMRLRANTLAVQAAVTFAFLLFILTTSNPFVRVSPAPIEGQDLNPVLQDPGLAIHPPLLYLGYVGFSITFAFAMAALIDGRIDAVWARAVRPWPRASGTPAGRGPGRGSTTWPSGSSRRPAGTTWCSPSTRCGCSAPSSPMRPIRRRRCGLAQPGPAHHG